MQAFASNWVPEIPLENIGVIAGLNGLGGFRFTMEFAFSSPRTRAASG